MGQSDHEIDPPNDAKEVARLKAVAAQREQANAAKYKLLNEKHGVVIPREAVEANRVEFALDYLFPEGTVDRAELDVAWQAHIAEVLEKVHADVLEKQRAQRDGLVLAEKKLIVPGA